MRLANETSGLAFCGTDLGHIFDDYVENGLGVLMVGKGPHELEFAYDIVRIHSLMFYTDLVEWNIVEEQNSLAAMLSLYLKAKGRRHYNNWTVHELSDIQ